MAYNYLTSTGVIVPDTSTTKAEVEQEWRDLFGSDLVIDDESPEGVLIGAEVTNRDSVARNNAEIANQINPNIAGGVALDALFALFGGQRVAATRSTFTINPTVTGVAGALIPAGSRAKAGDIEFETTSSINIPASGTGSVPFRAVLPGPINVGVGELNEIVTAVLGWETVTNSVAATPGTLLESDATARSRRRDVLGQQSRGLPTSTIARLRSISGVLGVAFRENITGTDQAIDGVFLLKNSIWVAVDGGTDAEVAQALLSSKTGGANWNGAITVNATDESSGQTYPVKFDRPTDAPLTVRVTASVPASLIDPQAAINDAVVAYGAGTIDGFDGFSVRDTSVSAYEIAAAINSEVPGVIINNVQIGRVSGGAFTSTELALTLPEKASILATNVSVTIR